jgi:hypothetical protein
MIVVPSFTEREQRHPPTVSRIIIGSKSTPTPHMRRGVDQPGGVQVENYSKEDAPHQDRPTSQAEQQQPAEHNRDVVQPVEIPVKAILHHVWRIAPQDCWLMHLSSAGENPTHVRPPAPIARRVRVAFAVSVRVMYPVRDDPVDRPTFKGQRPAERQKIFYGFRRLVAPVRQEAVKAHADAQAPRHPPEHGSRNHGLPAKGEERGHCGQVKDHHPDAGRPVDFLRFITDTRFLVHKTPSGLGVAASSRSDDLFAQWPVMVLDPFLPT